MSKSQVSLKSIVALISIGLLTMNYAVGQQSQPDNDYWWPNMLSLEPLNNNAQSAVPEGMEFDYAEAYESLDMDGLKEDLIELMTTSQGWWPADFGHYGPFFIRMAWHSAGTYRTTDGRGGSDGGMQRFAPLNSWPDNANLDKARYLLLPIKKKYGRAISWADLMILAGTVAMESMGFETLGFAGGREDAWKPDDVNWGPEGEWLAADRRDSTGALRKPFGATQMGLIYVNPQGPGGNSDPQAAADAIREAFGLMAMNDEETVALIAGGHTFGKAHGAASPDDYVGVEPEGAGIEDQGLGWRNTYGSGNAADTITSGLEGAWTINPAAWTHNYLENLYGYEWVQTTSPAGAIQWEPADGAASNLVPDAHDSSVRHAPMMFTTDLALKVDPAYRAITTRWLENPEQFEDAFARAWFKLTHRDMGPSSRYLGDLTPDQQLLWQDPIPQEGSSSGLRSRDIAEFKASILDSGLNVSELVRTAWSSASSFRGTDYRGGANGARLRLAPQRTWGANDASEIDRVLGVLEGIQNDFNDRNSRRNVSLADLIVLGGAAAIEHAASEGGFEIEVPFVPGRSDASQSETDVDSFAVLEPTSDGFRNYFGDGNSRSPAEMLIEKSALLELTAPEMAVLVAGMRVLDANAEGSSHGVFTATPGVLNNSFFVNLTDMSIVWSRSSTEAIYEGRGRDSNEVEFTATPVDLIFGSNSELRAISEFYASDDAKESFVNDFVAAWTKVMTLDRFDFDS
ncbi:MAG: catalase/peroxidase HPI [Gammaproteobacteria bacterium]|nr:catalase/peroxidase HPI [Gammaproteobacteria bacterium]